VGRLIEREGAEAHTAEAGLHPVGDEMGDGDHQNGPGRQGEAERRPRRRSNNGAVGQQHRHATLLPDHAVALEHEVGGAWARRSATAVSSMAERNSH
jgi:hypothetical protein